MNLPRLCVVAELESQRKTLADLPEWVIAECDLGSEKSIQRFRIGEIAYDIENKNDSPSKQCQAKHYIVKRIIGTIVCE